MAARRTALFLSAAGLCLALGATAAAQGPAREIGVGETLRGELTTSDTRRGDNSYYDVYRLQAQAGESYSVDLLSEDFDAFLTITGPAGYDESDDDGGQGTNSRLQFTAPVNGVYEIWANSLGEETGRYGLSIDTISSSEGPGGDIRVGGSVDGTLGSRSPQRENGAAYEVFNFSGEAGERVRIELRSDDFDSFLILRRSGSDEEIASDDDSAGNLNSRINFTLPDAGPYEILASALGSGETGDFALSVEPGPERVTPKPAGIAYGQIRRGELTEEDGIDDEDRVYDLYEFTGRAGDRVTITLVSDDFDPFVYLTAAGDDVILVEDDDGGDGPLDSLIEFTLPRNGAYRIHAASFESFDGGAYILGLGGGRPERGE